MKEKDNKSTDIKDKKDASYPSKKLGLSKTSQAVADLQKTLDSLKGYTKNSTSNIESKTLSSKDSVNIPQKQENASPSNNKNTIEKPYSDNSSDSANLQKQESPSSSNNKSTIEKPHSDNSSNNAAHQTKTDKKFNILGKFGVANNSTSKEQEQNTNVAPVSNKEQESIVANKQNTLLNKQENKTTKTKNILFNKIGKDSKEDSSKQEDKPIEVSDNNKEVIEANVLQSNEQETDNSKVVLQNKETSTEKSSEPEKSKQEQKGESKENNPTKPLANIFESAEQQKNDALLVEATEDEDSINLKVKAKEDIHHDSEFMQGVIDSVKREIEELDLVVDKEGNVLNEETKKRNNSRYLKASFAKIVDTFQISIDQDVLFCNISESKNGVINTAFLAEAGKRADIRVEINRINLVDVKTNNCIILLRNGKSLVVVDDETLYDPEQNCYLEFDKQAVSRHYIGYTIFFHNQEFSVTEFLKKSTIFSGYIRTNIPMFLEILVLSFLINLFVIVTPFYTINIYDRVIPNNAIPTLIVLSTGMALVYIFDFVFKTIRSYITDYVSSDIGSNIDKTLMDKMLGAKASGITMSNGGKINLFKELQSIREFYFSRFIPSLIDMPFVFLFLFVLFIISPVMSLVPLIGVFIIFIVNILFQVPLQGSYGNIIRTDQSRIAYLNETVHSVDTIKLFNASGKRLTGWTRALGDYYQSSFKYSFTINTAAHLSLMIMNLLTIAVLIVGVIEIKNLAITIGALIAANTLSTRIVTPMVTFSGLVVRYRSIQQTLLYVQKFMEQPAEDYGLNNSSRKGPFKGGIQFDKVSFIYPNNKLPILNKCSFDIKPKEKVGIIGRTGAGKSTITRLLTGLDFPNDGAIKVDGIELENINIVELRKSIGFLPQKSQFFHASIRDNILLSSKNVTKEQYDKACALSGVDMLKDLSGKGDDMVIQEGGTNLSGGQQQIIALARAIINEPPIIIMDEPTNGMDTSLEAKFMQNVANYVKDRTFILITHRATQLSLVDRLILLERGNIVIDDEKTKVLSKLNSSKQ